MSRSPNKAMISRASERQLPLFVPDRARPHEGERDSATPPTPPVRAHCPMARVAPDHHIVFDAPVGIVAPVLKGSRQPARGDVLGAEPIDPSPFKVDRPRVYIGRGR